MSHSNVVERVKAGLIVSCQALPGEPLYTDQGGVMPLLALAAEQAGAVAIRSNSARDVRQIRERVALPIIGLIKKQYPPYEPYITATMAEIDALVEAGADVIALDCTLRDRVDGMTPTQFIGAIKAKYPDQILMADIATFDEGVAAAQAGVEFVGTTLSGYTPQSADAQAPNFTLVKALVESVSAAVVAEGKISTPEQARQMLELGAHCVVVGGAITRPLEIAQRFMQAIRETTPSSAS